ncbi:MAG: DUF333 domain-containing protein [Candidatus Buchananbacteria bacterium]
MIDKNLKTIFFVAIAVIILVTAFILILTQSSEDNWFCQDGQWLMHGKPDSKKPTYPCLATNQNQNAGLANPAATYCNEHNGKSEIKTSTDGSQYGVCNFTDGSACEEWAYLRGQCQIGNKIIVIQPNLNQEFSFPLEITGQAKGSWFFEASFPIKLLDEKNQVIAQTVATAQGDWMTQNFVDFKAILVGSILSQAGQIPVTLVLERDNPSGLPQNDEKISIPLILNQPETTKINIFFGNSKLDPEVMDCKKVFAVQKIVPKTLAIGQAALEELLKGPSEADKIAGYFTSINSGVKIQKLTIENGVANVDFDQTLQSGVGGSCKVAAIAAQITETLKQFPTVKKVVISIDGQTEDILQP